VEPAVPDEEGFYFACKFADVEVGHGLRVKINRTAVAIFKIKTDKTRIYAIANACTHQGTSLYSMPSYRQPTPTDGLFLKTFNHKHCADVGEVAFDVARWRY
jgi:hypothetical protein